MNERLSDQQFDYLKKLVADDIQKQTKAKNSGNLERADVLLKLIKIHALEKIGITGTKTGTKVCKECGVEKPLESFHTQVHMKDGRANVCKECFKIYSRDRYRQMKGCQE